MEQVKASLENNTVVLDNTGVDMYSGSMTAPIARSVNSVTEYTLEVTAMGDNGESTTEKTAVLVMGEDIFPLQCIAAKQNGEEVGFCDKEIEMDFDLGDTNDFEMSVSLEKWTEEKYYYDNRLFVPGTEYGGIIKDMEVDTGNNTVIIRGSTWRGMLSGKVVVPPDNNSHLILDGEINTVLRELIGNRFSSLFVVPEINTGITVTNWKVDRYVLLYDAIMKLLNAYSQRLQIMYCQPEGLEYGYVTLQAVPVKDYSDEIEYSQDGKIHFTVQDYRGGINHLVCIGMGQNEERTVLDLYLQEDGTIGPNQYYFGLDCKEAIYEYSSAEEDELRTEGTKRFQELRNYKRIDVRVDDIELELGDIIGGYEQVTDTQIKKPIVGKILRSSGGDVTIEYKVKGED